MAASLASNLHSSPVLPSRRLRQDSAVLTTISRTAEAYSSRQLRRVTVTAAVTQASGNDQAKQPATSDGGSASNDITSSSSSSSSSGASGGKMPAPGFYGGAPLDTRVRQSWGGKREDPLTSGSYIWNTDWDKALDSEELQQTKAAAAAAAGGAGAAGGREGQGKRLLSKPPPSLTPSASSSSAGFLSLGRSLALDS